MIGVTMSPLKHPLAPAVIAALLLGSARAEAQPLTGAAFEPVALVQLWGTVLDQDLDPQADPAGYGDPEDDPGFKLRRARLGARGSFAGGLSYEVVLGVASPYDVWDERTEDVRLVDAALGWQRGEFFLKAGQQKIPYSREQLLSAGELVFTDRAVSSEHMVPGRETGLVAGHVFGPVAVQAGLFNGSGSFLGDHNVGMLAVLRGEYTMGDRVETTRTWGAVGRPVLSVGLNALYDDGLATSTMGAGADLLFRTGGLALLVEAHLAEIAPTATDVAPPGVADTTVRRGGLAQVGYTLGPIEPAVRFSMYDDNTAVSDNGDVAELLGGVTWHTTADVGRLGIGWVHRMELGGRTLPNDTLRVWAQVRY